MPPPSVVVSPSVDPAVVVRAGMSTGDGAVQPRVTRPACAWRCDGSLVVEWRTETAKSSTIGAENHKLYIM